MSNNKIINKKLQNIKENSNEAIKQNYNFIEDILKKEIGLLIDDFVKTNMGIPITKYSANTFAIWCIEAIQKSSIMIQEEINKLIKDLGIIKNK